MVVKSTQRRLRSSRWAVLLVGFAITLVIAAALLHRLFGLATPVALNLIMLAFVVIGLAVLLAAVALVRIWRHGYRGASSALIAITVSLLLLLWPVSLLPTMHALPMINDVTTDTNNPPEFVDIVPLRPSGSNQVGYPGEAFAEAQKQAYPDLRTFEVGRHPAEVVTLVGQAMRKLKMQVISETAPESGTGLGRVEAVDRTLIFGFYDDVVVRVAAAGRGALVDVRSKSRFGRHDLGRNAARVRELLKALVERIQATVPERRKRRGRRPRRRSNRS